MPRTKIVCTIGPASESPEILEEMILGGMNVARLNFSHGSHEEHKAKITNIRRISDSLGKHIAILQDLCGPKIRIGTIPEPGIQLLPDQYITLTSDPVEGSLKRVSVSYKDLPAEVNSGDTLLLADGLIELEVVRASSNEVYCKIVIGGYLTSNKGINLPSGSLNTPSLTQKDLIDLEFGLANDVDFIALSFVRSAQDIYDLKDRIAQKNKTTPVIAKIEKHEAISNIDEIMDACDGIMVARGDLGVEVPLEKIPLIQKKLIKKANSLGKPVIIATQMLRSMVDSPRPTRAEVTDVANGVLDGTDAVMLSEESASGKYPVDAVHYLKRIAETTEQDFPHDRYLQSIPHENTSECVAQATCVLAERLHADAIITPTRSGRTAMHIARFRPRYPIIALSPETKVIRSLALYWGCYGSLVEHSTDSDKMFDSAPISALKTGKVTKGDKLVVTGGSPGWVAGTTNTVQVLDL
ncbi:pyruvate kinase [Desulforhopalus sp. 52FAK]